MVWSCIQRRSQFRYRYVLTDMMGLSCSTVSDRVLFSPLVDEEKKCMLLVMRVLSIVPLNFKVRQFFFFFFRVGRELLRRFHDQNRTTTHTKTDAHIYYAFTAYAVVRSTVPGIAGVQLVRSIPYSSAQNVIGGNLAEHASPE